MPIAAARAANPEQVREQDRQYKQRNPERTAFHRAKAHAKRRGIDWHLSYEEFVTFWGDDFSKRGRAGTDLCMGRFNEDDGHDVGGYTLDNVVKLTNTDNCVAANGVRQA